MTRAVLDEVEALQRSEQTRQATQWLELVTACVDHDLPPPDVISQVFRDSGKGRKDLERDAALLAEYRSEQARLADAPEQQAKVAELARELSVAVAERDAAEQALRDAQDKVARVDAAHSGAGRVLREAQNAAARLRNPKFNVIRGDAPSTTQADQLTREIANLESRLNEASQMLEAKRQAMTRLERERHDVSGSDMPEEERDAKLAELAGAVEVTAQAINRHGREQHELRRELAGKKRELKEHQPGEFGAYGFSPIKWSSS